MAKQTKDIEEMLDYLNLNTMSKSLSEKIRSTEYPSSDPIQFFRDVVSDQYVEQINNDFARSLRLAKLKGTDAQIELLQSGNGRKYHDPTIKQLATLEFIADRKNIAIFGESSAGKTFASKAFGVEACRNGYRTLFTDFTELIDILYILKNEDLRSYMKKLTFYSKIQVLILDDFLINQLDEERSVILFSLVKKRDELGTSTIVTSQYEPKTWSSFLESNGKFAMGDSIRRRLLNNGFTILIEMAV